jgi:hypothetical protein
MEVYVKESLHVLDYGNNVVDSIFISDDHMTPGYAYDITITEANTGYSDLKFNMPNMVIDGEGNKIHNPKLRLLTPLVKLRYHREVYYRGDKEITVREPQGYGDKVVYIDKTYKPTYPENIIEDYVMDYIVQPVDKKRDVLKLTTAFTAIDYPRFNLSKKKVGLNITTDTLTKEEWSLYENKPMDVPGKVKYEAWTNNLTVAAGKTVNSVPLEWYPDTANEYPLDEAAITNLMNNTASWPYGLLGTAFYWPIKSTGRFEGQMYREGGYLVLQLYDFYALTKEGVDPDKHVGRYSWEWTFLEKVDDYLTPNNACNYLYHILDGTNWSVKLKPDGSPEVDIVQVEVSNPKGSTVAKEMVDHTCNINVTNSNCYNAITAVCKGLQLYPIFNCKERTVSLKTFAGKNYGLTYKLGSNLSSNSVKNDGDKVITKLYVTGGQDNTGSQSINIGEAERSYFEPTDNPDERNPWDPNAPEYIIKRSPYGTNYILNFKWMYDNKWMTKEQILGLYAINQQINDLNKSFMAPYTEDRRKTLQMYNDAVNEYDLRQGEYKSVLNSMMNKYYYSYGQSSKGSFYAFHKAPLGLHNGEYSQNKGKKCLWIGHCKNCGATWSSQAKPTTCTCGDPILQVEEIYIPLYSDFKDKVQVPAQMEHPFGPTITDPAYAPHIKGDYFRLVTTLDSENNSYTISDYESKISIIDTIPTSGRTLDGWAFKLGDVYVRSSSGHIEEWNEDIHGVKSFVYAYGAMLDALDRVNYCLEKIEELDQRYKEWEVQYNALQSQIQKNYGDYIVEGNYTNTDQPYVGLLFEEGMEASNKYCIPEITYSLNVVDSSGLIEYRQPTSGIYSCSSCNHVSESKIDVCPKCGDTTIIATKDSYNDLVHLLHSVGQIIPKAGDYTTIYDEAMGMYGVPGLITQISRTLDKPINNKIQLDTAYTDNEELVGNIITATNTVLNNADIYARTAILKADGTIDSSAISKTINSPNANISIVGTNGNMLLTGSALQFTDPNDTQRAMKYSGTGIFSTTTLDENGEGTVWEKMMTPSGINASYINAGAIDTSRINIMSGLSAKVGMDQYGLTIKKDGNKSSHITTFDSTSAANNASYVKNWGTTNNIAAFIGVDPDNNPLVYTKGFLVAENGSNIANWITSDKGFYHLNGTTKDMWMSPGGLSGTVNGTSTDYMLYAGGKFGVTTGGTLKATGADISGKIVVTDTSSTVNNGTVGGFTSSDKGLTKGTIVLSPSGGAVTGAVHDSGSRSDWAIYANGNFGVTTNGNLYATSAHIKGDIYAESGTFNGTVYADGGSFKGTIETTNLNASGTVTINGASIKNGTIESATIKSCSIDAGQINSGTLSSARISSLSASKISGGTLNIGANGGYIKVGVGYTHPEVSGINITGSNGIAFNGNSISGLGTINMDGGGTGQTATVSIAYNFTWATRASVLTGVSYKTAELSFKNGIFIGIGNIQDKEVAIG